MGIPTVDSFQAGRVTQQGNSEFVKQRLYDFNLYPTAGVNQLTFFQNPVGQGLASALGSVAGQPKSYADTNMNLAGQLPSGMSYLVESIEIVFFPGSVATANTYTPAQPSQYNAALSAALALQTNDVNVIYQSGLLEVNILQKNYLRETPLLSFPPKCYFDGESTVAVAGVTGAAEIITFHASGRPYYIEGGITLQPAVNFEVVVKYPAQVATPSGFNGRIGCYLDGWLMRAAQ